MINLENKIAQENYFTRVHFALYNISTLKDSLF